MRRFSPLALATLPLVGCFGVFNPTLDDDVGESPDTSSGESSDTVAETTATSDTADTTETSDTATSDTADTTETTDSSDTTETGDPMCDIDQAQVGNDCMGLVFTVTSGNLPTDLVLAELSGDGVLDLLVANDGAFVNFHLGSPGALGPVSGINNTPARGLALGNIDDNDPLDFAAIGPGNVAMVASIGDGMFGILETLPTGPGWDAVFGDIDGLEGEDLLISATGVPGVQVWIAEMGDTYMQVPALVATAPQGLALGDFDGDGDLDVAVADHGDGRLLLYENNGSGAFASGPQLAVSNVYDVAAGNLDGDDADEVMAVGSTMGVVVVVDMDIDFAIEQSAPHPVGQAPRRIALGDVDGDGRLDAVTANSVSDDASILLGDGNGGFLPEIRLPSDPATVQAESVVLGDVIPGSVGADEILIGGLASGDIAVFAFEP